MAKYFGQGIPLTASFDLSGQKPLDARDVVETIAERDAMPAIQKYEGMRVFVVETKLTYQLINTDGVESWVKFGTNSDTVIANLANVATSGSYTDLKNTPALNCVGQNEEPTDGTVRLWVDSSGCQVD